MFNHKPALIHDQLLAAIPVRNTLVREKALPSKPDQPLATPILRLTAPMAASRLRSLRTKAPQEKSFDLDPLGAFIWRHADGTRTVESLITAFAEHHQLALREAEVPVLAFLKTLTQRNLIALLMKASR